MNSTSSENTIRIGIGYAEEKAEDAEEAPMESMHPLNCSAGGAMSPSDTRPGSCSKTTRTELKSFEF